MRKIKMRTLSCGPGGNLNPGETAEVSDEDAQALVAGGFAEELSEPVVADKPKATKTKEPKKPEPEAEAAIEEPAELAILNTEPEKAEPPKKPRTRKSRAKKGKEK